MSISPPITLGVLVMWGSCDISTTQTTSHLFSHIPLNFCGPSFQGTFKNTPIRANIHVCMIYLKVF